MSKTFIKKFQTYRTKKLETLGKFFIKIGVSANTMSLFQLAMGLAAVYSLFVSYPLFIIFSVLHLMGDAMDGVIARLTKTTKIGKYLDHYTDRTVTFLIIIKIGWFLQDYYAYIIAGLFLLVQISYALSHFKAPILFTRTLTLILVTLILPFPTFLPIVYLVTGIAVVYSMARQLQWWISHLNIR